MKHKVFTSIISLVLFFSTALPSHASPMAEEQDLSALPKTIPLNKRKTISSEADKENQQNMSNHYKKQKPSKFKKQSSKSRPKPSPLLKLKKEIESLTRSIEEAYSTASRLDLFQSYKAFRKLRYPEEVWHTLGQQIKAEQWPSQESWKEIIGGQLFFPASRLHDWQGSPYTEHLLQRSDILHGCIFAASFQHSLGLFYTTHILWMINRFDDDLKNDRELNKPNFYTRMMQKACCELEQCLDKPDVCYALGQGDILPTSLSDNYIKMNAIELYEKGSDLKNQCAALGLKASRRGYTGSPIEAFLALARQGYLPAYIEAAEHAQKAKQKEVEKLILEKAIEQDYPLAWIDLAYWYDKHGQKEESLMCLEKAAQAKVSYGFIGLGFKLAGDRLHRLDMEKLQKTSSLDLNQACDYFKKAGELHDPHGYEYLTNLKLALSRLSQDKEKALFLKAEALEAAKQGCALGWEMSYCSLATLLSDEKYIDALKVYGAPPSELPASVEAFLNKEIGSELPNQKN
ncbi:hypothetical protein IM40_10410 (plasmid) [Candidatus Paracaedimonas acanthamoebae]|nr:hypothetical protein IM40_10410 [Candidatus Paracaedimonas acanthamoebae]